MWGWPWLGRSGAAAAAPDSKLDVNSGIARACTLRHLATCGVICMERRCVQGAASVVLLYDGGLLPASLGQRPCAAPAQLRAAARQSAHAALRRVGLQWCAQLAKCQPCKHQLFRHSSCGHACNCMLHSGLLRCSQAVCTVDVTSRSVFQWSANELLPNSAARSRSACRLIHCTASACHSRCKPH